MILDFILVKSQIKAVEDEFLKEIAQIAVEAAKPKRPDHSASKTKEN